MSDIAPATIRELLRDFVNAPTWAASQEIVMQHQAELLTDDADADLAAWMAEIPDAETLAWYREVLQLCRTKGIDATFNSLPEPHPLNKAIRAFINANGPESLLQVIHNFPEITSETAAKALQELITQRQVTDQEAANKLTAHLAMIEMVKLANRPMNEELAQLLIEWINADTWEQSQEIIKTNAERLLSDEALETLIKLILMGASEEVDDDENEEEDDSTKTLLLHRAILEKAREGSIEEAYAELLKPSPLTLDLKGLPDELRDAIQAMIIVSSSAELLEQVTQHPVLITEQATAAIDKLLSDLRQVGQEDIVDHIEQRYNTLKEVMASAQDPRLKAINALLQANTPGALQQIIGEYPILLEDETLDMSMEIALRSEQEGNTVVAQQLRLRLGEVRRIRQRHEQPLASLGLDKPDLTDRVERVKIHADSGGMAIYTSSGTISQTNIEIENYALPTRKWLRPVRQTLNKTFIGRQDELDTLRKNLTEGESVAITGKKIATTVQGMGGIGKTYLARQLAFELHPHFSGGVIWIDLGPQVTDEVTAQVPLHKLASFAFDGTQPPFGQLHPEQVAAWLQEMAPGRLLVIFDDVWHQVPLRFLEQALPSNAVQLITTRYANVAQTLGGKLLPLDRLTPEDGLILLEDRLDCQGSTTYTYKSDLEALVELLGGHALALDIAAALIKKRPSRVHAVQSVIENLRQGIGRGKLDSLSLPPSEERDENLEKSFALSYDRMTAYQQIHFRALGVFAAETPITPEAAAAVWGIDDLNAAQNALNDLVDLALLTEIEESSGITYRQHGLLRVYAWALLDKEGELTSASWAHAQYYKNMSLQAETVTPKDYLLLDRHIQNLLAALQWTIENEPILFSQLIEASSQFLRLRGQWALLETYLPKAAAAAATMGNKQRQANTLQSLGDLERRLGNIDQARAHYDAALPLFRAERDRLGEANVYMSLADMFLANKEWIQARTYYEQALSLFVILRDPQGQANTLIDLGRARFELGDHDQGIQDVQQAATLFRSVQDEEWAHRAELYLAQMHARLANPGEDIQSTLAVDAELLEAFINVDSPQALLQLVQQNPQLLSDAWLTLIEELITAQVDDSNRQLLEERLDSLRQIRQAIAEQSDINQEVARALIDFANADWAKRRQLLTDHADLLLSDLVEPVFERLLEANEDKDAIHELERLRTLLQRCRTRGIDAAWYLALGMRLGDDIDIPPEYEEAVMHVADLLSRQQENDTALEQSVEAMQVLLSSLPDEQPDLFRAALLRDLADAIFALPSDRPARKLDQVESYYREALPCYQAVDRSISVAFIQRSLGDTLNDQGRYDEALEFFQTAIEVLKADDYRKDEAAWALSSYASSLDNLGRTEEALAAYAEAMTLLPDTPALLRNRADALIHARRLEEANADLARAIELDGNEDSLYLWLRRAQLAIARGNGLLANQMLDEVIKRDQSQDVLLQRAQSAWLLGDLKAAQDELRQAFEKANSGDRVVIRREMQRLLDDHPNVPGKDEMLKLLN